MIVVDCRTDTTGAIYLPTGGTYVGWFDLAQPHGVAPPHYYAPRTGYLAGWLMLHLPGYWPYHVAKRCLRIPGLHVVHLYVTVTVMRWLPLLICYVPRLVVVPLRLPTFICGFTVVVTRLRLGVVQFIVTLLH